MRIKTARFNLLLNVSCCLIVISCLSSCDRDDDAVTEPTLSREGEVRPPGDPLESEETFTVDQNGGTYATQDEAVVLMFPAGAVTSATRVSIQKIASTTPNGVGYAYRLTPHMDFNAPVVVQITYPLDSVSLIEGLGIAFQDDRGIWNAVPLRSHIRDKQILEVETTHFSDWSVFQSVKISPSMSVIQPGETVTLSATAVFKGEELLTPLTEVSTPLRTAPLDEKYISSWDLDGPGTLTPLGSTAKYKAGDDFRSEVAEVALSLNVPGSPASAANAVILTGGSYVTFAGGPYGSGVTVYGFSYGIHDPKGNATTLIFKGNSDAGDFSVAIVYSGKGTGVFPWSAEKDKESAVLSTHTFPGGSYSGTFGSLDEDDGHHTGSITIESYQPVGKYIIGSFNGGYTYMKDGRVENISIGSISGNFIAKRYQ